MAHKTIESLFADRERERSAKLERARYHSMSASPSLLPLDGFNQNTELPVPYTSSTTRMVVRLAAKAGSAVYPINGSTFFNLNLAGFEPSDAPDVYNELFYIETQVMDKLSASNFRSTLVAALEHLIVIGDVVLFQDDNFNFQLFRLDQFTVKRDGAGNLKELIVRDWIDVDMEDPAYAAANGGMKKQWNPGTTYNNNLEPRYTKIVWDRDSSTWNKTVEFRGETLAQFEDSYPEGLMPYYVLRWAALANEDYGRSLVEENIGDIRSMEGIGKSLFEGAAAGSEGRVMVDPTGFTQLEDLEDSDNWSFVSGRLEDIGFMQADVRIQLQHTLAIKDMLERMLARVFLEDQAGNLTGERVTATQIRALAAQLEEALGGVFSLFARDIQLPVVRRSIYTIREFTTLFDNLSVEATELINQDLIDIEVRTGLDALGRELDGARMQATFDTILRLPTEAQVVVDWAEAARDWIRAQGINPNWVRSEEDIARVKQDELLSSVAPDIINALSRGNQNGPPAPVEPGPAG